MSERSRANSRAYYYRHREKILAKQRGKPPRARSEETKEKDRLRARARARSRAHEIQEYKLRLKYGISREQYDEMLSRQGGVYAICATDNPGLSRRMFCVDHNHESGQVRGLLCQVCNRALGLFRDNEALLVTASEYLRRYRSE